MYGKLLQKQVDSPWVRKPWKPFQTQAHRLVDSEITFRSYGSE